MSSSGEISSRENDRMPGECMILNVPQSIISAQRSVGPFTAPSDLVLTDIYLPVAKGGDQLALSYTGLAKNY